MLPISARGVELSALTDGRSFVGLPPTVCTRGAGCFIPEDETDRSKQMMTPSTLMSTRGRWQGGTDYNDYIAGATAMGTDDGSVVLCGKTNGNWWNSSKPTSLFFDRDDDFAVVALASNGTELWRWQVGAKLRQANLLLHTRLRLLQGKQ